VIELPAPRFAELVKACLIQHFVQTPIERVPRSFRQISAIPKLLLPLRLPARSHRHVDTQLGLRVVRGRRRLTNLAPVRLKKGYSRDPKPDESASERALLTSILTRSLVEEFLAKYLKGTVAPDLDLIVRLDKK
jgi:hypothetical protein